MLMHPGKSPSHSHRYETGCSMRCSQGQEPYARGLHNTCTSRIMAGPSMLLHVPPAALACLLRQGNASMVLGTESCSACHASTWDRGTHLGTCHASMVQAGSVGRTMPAHCEHL